METKTIQNKSDLFEKIKKKKLTGYIWMVEGKEPVVFTKEIIDFDKLNTTNNAFNKIQEAYLYDGTNSIHIKNIDGEELVFISNEDEFTDTETKKYKIDETVNYPSHITGIDNLHFKQVYQLTESVSGAEFKTWQPIVRLFKGFSNQQTPKKN